MHFAIETYDRNYLEEMVTLYNTETAFEPHIAPLDPATFVDLVEQKSYFDPSGVLIAVAEGQVRGWIHACLARGTEDHIDPNMAFASIVMLIYPRDQLKVGQALVNEATRWLEQTGHPHFLAMHLAGGYPFYRGLWLGGEPMAPATLPHVQLAFEVGGYQISQRELFMVVEMPTPPAELSPKVKAEFVETPATMTHQTMRESWLGFEPKQMSVSVAGEMAGEVGWVILPQIAAQLGAPCLNIYNLWISEAHRQQGLGAALVSRALARGYTQGARYGSLITGLTNVPAQNTYSKLGFKPYCLMLGRTLSR